MDGTVPLEILKRPQRLPIVISLTTPIFKRSIKDWMMFLLNIKFFCGVSVSIKKWIISRQECVGVFPQNNLARPGLNAPAFAV